MLRRVLLSVVILLLPAGVLPLAALAEEPPGPTAEELAEIYGRKGPYVGAGGIAVLPVAGVIDAGQNILNDAGAGFNVRLGLRTATWFALEVTYEQLDSFSYDPPGPEDSASARGYSWTLNGKFILRGTRKIQPYASLGGGIVSVRAGTRETGFGMRAALGVDFHLTKHIVLNPEGSFGFGLGTQVQDFQYGAIGAGILWRF